MKPHERESIQREEQELAQSIKAQLFIVIPICLCVFGVGFLVSNHFLNTNVGLMELFFVAILCCPTVFSEMWQLYLVRRNLKYD